jgi:isocitrate lyase
MLFLGCIPLGEGGKGVVYFDRLVVEAQRMIGDASYFGGFGYKTNGMMQEAIKRLLADLPGCDLVVTNPNTPMAAMCKEFLMGAAEGVIMGVV